MVTDNPNAATDKPSATKPNPTTETKPNHDAIQSLSDLLALTRNNAAQSGVSLENPTFDLLYGVSDGVPDSTVAKLTPSSGPTRAEATTTASQPVEKSSGHTAHSTQTPQTADSSEKTAGKTSGKPSEVTKQAANYLDFSANSPYASGTGKISEIQTAGIARSAPGGALEIPPVIAADSGLVRDNGQIAIARVDGPTNILDSRTNASSDLHFAGNAVVQRTAASDLAEHFQAQKNAGKLADDPLWQSYIHKELKDKVGGDDWQQFLKSDAGKASGITQDTTRNLVADSNVTAERNQITQQQHANEVVEKLSPDLQKKLKEFENDPNAKTTLDQLKKQVEDDPAWKKYVENSELKSLAAGADGKQLANIESFLKDPAAAKQLDNLGAQKQSEVDAHQTHLDAWADRELHEPERTKFKNDVQTFDERAKRDGLSPEQVAETYKQIERVAEAKGDAPLSPVERQHITEQIMHQAADPTTIDQGQHGTCNVASVEARTYTRTPADAARLVADVALTGQYRANDGTIVKIDPSPHDESHLFPTPDGKRSYASELFQVTAINIHYAKQNAKDGGDLHYKQVEPVKGDPADTGERLVDGKAWFFPDAGRAAGVSDADLTEISNAITGKNEKDVEVVQDHNFSGSKDNMLTVGSEAELKEKLKELKAQHKLPVIVHVNCMNEPFYTDSGQGSAGGSGGEHVVTITDYDEKTGKVCIDNQWGKAADHDSNNPVSVHDLYRAMGSTADAEKLIEQDIKYDHDHKIVDPVKELELLRYQKALNQISDQQFEDGIKKAIHDTQGRRGVSDGEKAAEGKELANLIHTLPPEAQIGLIQEEHSAKLIDDEKYKFELEIIGWKLGRENSHATRIFGINPFADRAYQKQLDELKHALADLPPDQQKDALEQMAEFLKNYP